jgi:hypothetical protein
MRATYLPNGRHPNSIRQAVPDCRRGARRSSGNRRLAHRAIVIGPVTALTIIDKLLLQQ